MATIWIPDAPPDSAGSEDEEFPTGDDLSAWTESDHGTVGSYSISNPSNGIQVYSATHAGNSLLGAYKSIPAGDFTYWTKVSLSGLAVTSTALGGIALWEDATSATGDIRTLALITNATQGQVSIHPWTAYNAQSAATLTQAITVDLGPTSMYLMVRRTSTTYAFSFSTDGVGWQQIYTTGSLGITPTHIGPCVDNANTGDDVTATFPFWRYLASDVGLTPVMEGNRVTVTLAA